MKTRVKIESPHFSVELHGDARFLEDAYTAIRGVVLNYVETAVIAEANEQTEPINVPEGPGKLHAWVQITHDLYRRVYAMERGKLQMSRFGDTLDFSQLDGVFVERNVRDTVARILPFGKPLWSELTNRGTDSTQAPQ